MNRRFAAFAMSMLLVAIVSVPVMSPTTSKSMQHRFREHRCGQRQSDAQLLVSCPINNLLDAPADFCAGQGAPTSHSGHYGEEAQRRPAQKDAAQRVSYLWDRTLALDTR